MMSMYRDEIQQLCAQYSVVPSRSKGQNFLLDASYCEVMVQAAELDDDNTVVEIGPGFAVLTEKLVATGARVVAVELERKVIPYLEHRFKDSANFTLIEGDILKEARNPKSEIRNLNSGSRSYKVVANLPYAITAAVLRTFLTVEHKPQQMVVMVQKEVAERICAQPGQMSLLALSVQYYADAEIIAYVPRFSFWPVPEVDSAIIHIKLITSTKGEFSSDGEKQFFRLARIAFTGKRKQLKNSLANGLHCSADDAEALLIKAGIKPITRPQELSVNDWQKLARIVSAS